MTEKCKLQPLTFTDIVNVNIGCHVSEQPVKLKLNQRCRKLCEKGVYLSQIIAGLIHTVLTLSALWSKSPQGLMLRAVIDDRQFLSHGLVLMDSI